MLPLRLTRHALFQRNRHLLDDLQAKALQSGNVHGCIREQADAPDAQVGQDLAAQADGAQNASAAGLRAFARAQLLMQNQPPALRIRRFIRNTGCPRSRF